MRMRVGRTRQDGLVSYWLELEESLEYARFSLMRVESLRRQFGFVWARGAGDGHRWRWFGFGVGFAYYGVGTNVGMRNWEVVEA